MRAGPSRLFHTIVVMGASIGCGAGRIATEPLDAADEAADGSLAAPDARPDVAAGTDAGEKDVESGPRSVCDCARPGTFRCANCAGAETPVNGRCRENDGTGCFCDESVQIAAPSDCEHPEQFVCEDSPDSDATTAGYGFEVQVHDWYAFASCYCDETRPVMASQCGCERCTFQCANPWTCDDVPPLADDGGLAGQSYACACLPELVTIK